MRDQVYGKANEKLIGTKKCTSTSITDEEFEDGALFNVLPAYEHLLSKLEQAKSKYIRDSWFGTCINLAWSKINKYYKKTDVSSTYLVATVLDPRVKLRYFESNWPQEWLVGVHEKLEAYTETFVKAMRLDHINELSTSTSDNDTPDSQENKTTFGSWR